MSNEKSTKKTKSPRKAKKTKSKKSSSKKSANNTDLSEPYKELQMAFDRVPQIVKRNARAAKEKAKIRKRFQEALGYLFN